jgi:hypothetical protein
MSNPNRRFVVRLEKQDKDKKKSVWKVIWGRQARDLDGNRIWVDDTTDLYTLVDLEGQIESLKEKGKLIQMIITEIKKAEQNGQNIQR